MSQFFIYNGTHACRVRHYNSAHIFNYQLSIQRFYELRFIGDYGNTVIVRKGLIRIIRKDVIVMRFINSLMVGISYKLQYCLLFVASVLRWLLFD